MEIYRNQTNDEERALYGTITAAGVKEIIMDDPEAEGQIFIEGE